MKMITRGRRWRRLILAGALVAPAGGCVGFPEDIERMERDLARLRQDVAGVTRNTEAARAMYEQRLTRLEGGPRVPDLPQGGQAELNQRLHELLGEYRTLQGKLEEHTAALEQLQRRLDGLEPRSADSRRANGSGTAAAPRVPATPAPVAPPPRPAPPSAAPAPGAFQARSATPAPAPPVAAPPGATPEETYKKALAEYTRGNFDSAISGFRAFAASYRGTAQAANAQYWVGEAYYSQRNYAQAVEEFGAVVRDYPDSAKVPSALFKQGEAYLQLNDSRQATSILCELIGKYPKSREAQLARERSPRCR